ncbi:ganglioside-induced differentiation-associated protein 1-like 1 isoform X1 [Ictalurus furcatus]|uniref:ganglioside-induced differentiation-associated protein 1-like 1 isoform X1 n=1 Tax=Ictalurus furcatus TaxID=66913 RepID=UPI00235067FA|nr:ganglioside-induced differentiation-associated protein 1-like 1 isoform X1 [Ictalurus furcatus]
MKVIFSDESRMCIGQGDDAGTFVWCRTNETDKDDCLKKTIKFPHSLMIWGFMSGKGPGETSTVNAQMYTEILHTFLIPSIENSFGGDEVVDQEDNVSCHGTKSVKAFLQGLNQMADSIAQLIPDEGTPMHARVKQYRELLDGLPMDAYTHGCILHPELTTDSMIPKYATAEIRRHLTNAASELMKLDHEEPQLTEPYLTKQKKLMAKILDHDNVNYLKKILVELAMVLDQVEAELEKRKLEYQGQKCELWLCGHDFTLADIYLGATLHRLKFLGLSKKYWEDGSRPNLQSFFERVQKRYAFRKVLGDIHATLLSAVLPNAFRMVKKKPPSFFGASFLMGSLGGMGYFAYWFLKKKYM